MPSPTGHVYGTELQYSNKCVDSATFFRVARNENGKLAKVSQKLASNWPNSQIKFLQLQLYEIGQKLAKYIFLATNFFFWPTPSKIGHLASLTFYLLSVYLFMIIEKIVNQIYHSDIHYRFPSLFAVETFHYFRSRVLNLQIR